MPLDARLRVLRVVPLVPLRALVPEDRRVRFIRRACVGCRQTVQVLPTFRASSRRRATELFFRGAVMVFLVFLEVLEMSAEVVGPGPNTREIKSLRVDPGPLACALPPDAGCMLPFGLFVVCVGGGPPGAPSWRCPQSSLFLFYKIQLSTGCRWYRCDSLKQPPVATFRPRGALDGYRTVPPLPPTTVGTVRVWV